ncbi:hypothetical protein SAMN05216563_108283 [Phytobacter palmae]|nr:hypothetical protein SAMN05216563_108283 [Phytobacter palmae]
MRRFKLLHAFYLGEKTAENPLPFCFNFPAINIQNNIRIRSGNVHYAVTLPFQVLLPTVKLDTLNNFLILLLMAFVKFTWTGRYIAHQFFPDRCGVQ